MPVTLNEIINYEAVMPHPVPSQTPVVDLSSFGDGGDELLRKKSFYNRWS